MEIRGDDVIFSTGKKCYANCGIIGLAEDLRVRYGYDGAFPAWKDCWGEECLTAAERVELADHMIAMWQEFKQATGPKESPQ